MVKAVVIYGRFAISIIALSACINLAACSGDEGPPNDPITPPKVCTGSFSPVSTCYVHIEALDKYSPSREPFIAGTNLIKVDSFQSDNFNTYRGDTIAQELEGRNLEFISCCSMVKYLGEMSTTPRLKWNAIDNELFAVGIFKRPIETSAYAINNPQDLVWLWHNGLSSTNIDNGMILVDYEDGRNVIDGEIADGAPAPLDSSTLYYWGVWAWNDHGTVIEATSNQLIFVTTPRIISVPLQDASQMTGKWRLMNLVRADNHADAFGKRPFDMLTFSYDWFLRGEECVSTFTAVDDRDTSSLSAEVRNSDVITPGYIFENILLSCNSFTCEFEISGVRYIARFEK